MAIPLDKSRCGVMGFVCGLTTFCGKDHPSKDEAESYSSRYHPLIGGPEEAIRILGVKDWDDVLRAYDRYIYHGSLEIGENPNHKKNRGNVHRYTDDELIRILCIISEENNGRVTQQIIYERSQITPTPSYSTFVKHLGSLKDWPQIIAKFKKAHSDETAHLNDETPSYS